MVVPSRTLSTLAVLSLEGGTPADSEAQDVRRRVQACVQGLIFLKYISGAFEAWHACRLDVHQNLGTTEG